MNWYKIFYWITVADGVKKFFDAASTTFTVFAILLFIVMIILIICRSCTIAVNGIKDDTSEKIDPDIRSINKALLIIKPLFYVALGLSLITWTAYVFVPSKKDALIIVAGGAVGNFITSDSSAKQIPFEITTLLRDKIRSEIKELHASPIVDTFQNKSKDELIEMLHNKK